MQKRRAGILCVFSILFFGVSVARASVVTSTNFQNFDSATVPATFEQSSANYEVTASVEHIVGKVTSTSFNSQVGVPLEDPPLPTPPAPTPTPAPGGGGGGGGGGYTPTTSTPAPGTIYVPPPTLEYKSPTFKNHRLISGKRDVTTAAIYVNGSTTDVKLVDTLRWQRDMPLFLGYNDLYIQAETPVGNKSEIVSGQIHRLLIGDVNTSRKVDDIDISLFTRAWKMYNFFADFNEDGLVDDIDLSLLASHWQKYY